MKFITYTKEGAVASGILSADEALAIPLSGALTRPVSSLTSFIADHTADDLARLEELARTIAPGQYGSLPADAVTLCAPIPRPIHDILCIGVNYMDHRKESRGPLATVDSDTVYFAKRATALTGPDGAVESHCSLDPKLDYEVELAVIIGKTGRDIPAEKAEDYIFGYSVFNDFSARTLQRAHLQWYRGKSLDSFAALGPCILHKSAMPFPVQVDIRSTVNGEMRQSSNTRHFIADLPTIISEFSQGLTLEAGDIIATGTPAGVGMGFDPPRFLVPGDTVVCEIAGIGSLRNTIR